MIPPASPPRDADGASGRARYRRILLAVFLLTAYLVGALSFGERGISYDGRQYLTYARNLIAGFGFTHDGTTPSCGRPPGYPAFLALFLLLFGGIDLVYAAQLLLLFIGYLAVASTLTDVLSATQRLVLVVAFALLWPVTKLGLTIQTEAVFISLTAAGLYFLSRFLREYRWPALTTSVLLLTLSAYVRPVTALFVLFAAAVLLVFRRIRMRHALAMCLFSVLLIAPWTYRNWRAFGRIVPMAANYGSIYYMTEETAFRAILLGGPAAVHQLPAFKEIVQADFELDLAVNDRYLARAEQNITADPLGFASRCLRKTLFLWIHFPGTRMLYTSTPAAFVLGVATHLVFLLSAGVGIVRLYARYPHAVWPAALFASYHILALLPFYAESRFLVPVYIVLFGFAFSTGVNLLGALGRVVRWVRKRAD